MAAGNQETHVYRAAPPRKPIRRIAVSPEGRHVAAVAEGGEVHIVRMAGVPAKP